MLIALSLLGHVEDLPALRTGALAPPARRRHPHRPRRLLRALAHGVVGRVGSPRSEDVPRRRRDDARAASRGPLQSSPPARPPRGVRAAADVSGGRVPRRRGRGLYGAAAPAGPERVLPGGRDHHRRARDLAHDVAGIVVAPPDADPGARARLGRHRQGDRRPRAHRASGRSRSSDSWTTTPPRRTRSRPAASCSARSRTCRRSSTSRSRTSSSWPRSTAGGTSRPRRCSTAGCGASPSRTGRRSTRRRPARSWSLTCGRAG